MVVRFIFWMYESFLYYNLMIIFRRLLEIPKLSIWDLLGMPKDYHVNSLLIYNLSIKFIFVCMLKWNMTYMETPFIQCLFIMFPARHPLRVVCICHLQNESSLGKPIRFIIQRLYMSGYMFYNTSYLPKMHSCQN